MRVFIATVTHACSAWRCGMVVGADDDRGEKIGAYCQEKRLINAHLHKN